MICPWSYWRLSCSLHRAKPWYQGSWPPITVVRLKTKVDESLDRLLELSRKAFLDRPSWIFGPTRRYRSTSFSSPSRRRWRREGHDGGEYTTPWPSSEQHRWPKNIWGRERTGHRRWLTFGIGIASVRLSSAKSSSMFLIRTERSTTSLSIESRCQLGGRGNEVTKCTTYRRSSSVHQRTSRLPVKSFWYELC